VTHARKSRAVHLEANKLPLKGAVTSHGDADESFRRAAAFVGDSVKDAMEKRWGSNPSAR
jgi:hypothetical protein